MNKIRIIDLLNKIANGEEVPKKIKYLGHIYNYDYEDVCYYDDDKQDLLEYALINCKYTAVNEEVEILDEPKEDKIEKLDLILDEHFTNDELQAYIYETQVKINNIIDKLNNIEK